MGLVGRRNAERHRDVAHHAQHGRYAHRGIGRLRDDADIERRPRETVARTVRSGQHLQTSDRLPIVVDGQLQIVTRRIGHHPILPALMDPKPAVDVFQNGAVARRIRNGQMQARLRAVGHVGCVDVNPVAPQRTDRLGHRSEIVEHVLRPHRDPHHGTLALLAVIRFGQKEQAGYQPRFVHAVARGEIVGRSDHAAVLGTPAKRRVAVVSGAFHAAGEEVEVRPDLLLPIHRPPRNDQPVTPQIDRPRTGIGSRRSREEGQRTGRRSPESSCLHLTCNLRAGFVPPRTNVHIRCRNRRTDAHQRR